VTNFDAALLFRRTRDERQLDHVGLSGGAMTSYATLRYELEDELLTITLCRPERLNAFTVQMAHELVDAFERASADDAVRAVIVTGSGSVFCAGMDLSVEGNVFGLDETQSPTWRDLTERLDDPAIRNGVRDTGGMVALAIYACLKPVIAAINGTAVGVGATMTLPMDARLICDQGRMGFVFGKIGIVPESCSTWFLPRIVGLPKALDLVYSARILDAQESLQLGLVSAVYEADELLKAARTLARSYIEARSPAATALTRQMMWRNSAFNDPLDAHRAESLAVFYTSRGDGKEGVAAFREKRTPHFHANPSELPDAAFAPPGTAGVTAGHDAHGVERRSPLRPE
jgi:enoyl-CoA hydratase/carnithine racemase